MHKIGFIIGVKSVAEFARDFKDSMKNILSEMKRNGEYARLSANGVLLKSKKRNIERGGKKITFYVPDFEVKLGEGVSPDFGKELKNFVEEYREYRKRLNMESLKAVEGMENEEDIGDVEL